MLRGLILDLDGLLIDSERWSWQAHNEALSTYGLLPLSLDEVRKLVGLAGPEEWEALGYMRTVTGDLDSYDRLHRAAFISIREQHLAPLPGVFEMLATAKEATLRIALASNSGMPSILSALKGLGIESYFDGLASGADVQAGKPAPDVYLRALELLNLGADEAVAIEDSKVGIDAATAAGLLCVAVPNEITVVQDLAKAHVVLGSLHEATAWLLEHSAAALPDTSERSA